MARLAGSMPASAVSSKSETALKSTPDVLKKLMLVRLYIPAALDVQNVHEKGPSQRYLWGSIPTSFRLDQAFW